MDDGGSRPSDWGRVDDIELTNILGTRAEIEALRAQQQDEDRRFQAILFCILFQLYSATVTVVC